MRGSGRWLSFAFAMLGCAGNAVPEASQNKPPASMVTKARSTNATKSQQTVDASSSNAATAQRASSGAATASGAASEPDCASGCADAAVPSDSTARVAEMGRTADTTADDDPNLDCAEFHAHGIAQPDDTSPFPVPAGQELSRCFYFASPWSEDQQGVRVDWSQNPLPVVHHALLYSMAPGHDPGTIEECGGLHFDGVLMPAFGVDKLPADTAFQVPSQSGQTFMLEIHYVNTGDATTDSTGLKLCVTRTPRPKTASLTWLGTESIGGLTGIPPGMTTTVSGSCTPARAGLKDSDDIHMLLLAPHMHLLGISSQTIVHRKDGTSETLLDASYDYASPQSYVLNTTLHAGDTLEARCTYNNTTDGYVAYGPSLTDEMCYILGLAYPADALDNPSLSIVGAQNTCFW